MKRFIWKVVTGFLNVSWLEIVTSDLHLKSEIPSMIPAWKGSIDMQNSHGNFENFPNVMQLEGLIQAISESGDVDEIFTRFVKNEGS